MIDKQMLLTWISDKNFVYSGPYANDVEENRCKGALKILSMLEISVAAGRLEACEDEPGPRFKMDAVGNLALVEDEAE